MKKQKLIKLLILTLILSLTALRPAFTSAATTDVTGGTNGPLCNSGGYFTPSSVTVASGDTITFSVPLNDPYSGGVQVNGFPQGSFVVPRGGSVTTHALTANVSYHGTWPHDPACIKGSGTVTVQAASTPPPSSGSSSGSGSSSSSQGANSTSSSSSSSKSSTTTTKSSSSTPAATTTTTPSPTTPETVVATTITVGGKKITSMGNLTITQSQPLVLSGTTVPNGTITLTIHSNPRTATVQADSSGKWTYTVTGLAAGSHTIYATVTDPSTKQTSTIAKLLSFSVTAPVASAVTVAATPAKTSMPVWMLALFGLLGLLIVGAVVLLAWKMRRKKVASQPVNSPIVTPTTEPTADSSNDDHKETQ